MIRRVALCAAAVLAVGSLWLGGGTSGWARRPLLINESGSMPRGLYVRAHGRGIGRGSIVTLDPPKAARPYLKSLGMPAGGLLLKRVVATPGDAICMRDRRLIWPGGAVRSLARDRRGVSLPSWRTCQPLADGQLLVLGDSPNSFDSRYFGPVDRAVVTGVYTQALTW